jgi:hypothetical protein
MYYNTIVLLLVIQQGTEEFSQKVAMNEQIWWCQYLFGTSYIIKWKLKFCSITSLYICLTKIGQGGSKGPIKMYETKMVSDISTKFHILK